MRHARNATHTFSGVISVESLFLEGFVVDKLPFTMAEIKWGNLKRIVFGKYCYDAGFDVKSVAGVVVECD